MTLFVNLFMAKEAVASYNIEHPEKPITLADYFLAYVAVSKRAAREKSRSDD